MPIGLLGPVVITDGFGADVSPPGRKSRALLALLALRAGRAVSVEQLEDEVWDGTPPPGARATVHAHISRLRGALRRAGSTVVVETTAAGYRLSATVDVADEVDSVRFETLVSDGIAQLDAHPARAIASLTRSLELWRGPALQEVQDCEVLTAEARRLEEVRLVALEHRWDAELRLGGHEVAVAALQRLVVDHPYRERLHGLLMLALHRSGRQREALRAFHVATSVLGEIGLVPGPELRELDRCIATRTPLPGHQQTPAPPQPPRESSPAAADDREDRDDHAGLASAALDAAVDHAVRAGDGAMAGARHDDAIGHYRLALGITELRPESPRRRVELLLACGRAYRAAYDVDAALSMFRAAVTSSASIGDGELLADATGGLALTSEFGMSDAATADMIERALASVPPSSPRRVEMLAGLARVTSGGPRRARAYARAAVASARLLDDPRPLATALATSVLVSWRPGCVAARLEEVDEVIALGEQLGWTDLAAEARNWRAATLAQLGRRHDAAIEEWLVTRWADSTGRRFFVALARMRSVAASLEAGDLDAAERLLNDTSATHAGPNFGEAAAAQLFLLRHAQGRAGELLDAVEAFIDGGQAPTSWRIGRVLALTQLGDHRASDALRAEVRALRGAPRDWLWLSSAALLADACIELGDARCAPALMRALADHRGQHVVMAHGIALLGPVDPRFEALRRVGATLTRAAA